jgi:acetyltransferase-like isoleucine patch superfamily enzyme
MASGINKIKFFFKLILNPGFLFDYIEKKRITRKFHNNNLKIGLKSRIQNAGFGNGNFVGENVTIENSVISDNSYIGDNSIVSYASIGKFCSVSSNVVIGLGIHPFNMVSTHPAFYSNNKAYKCFADRLYIEEHKETVIGNDVLIGMDVKIMDGIRIGDGAIITAGAIVTKDVEPYSIVGGIPAKLIKYRFSEDLINKLKKIPWWDFDEKWLEENFRLFHDTGLFIQYFEKNKK